MTLCFCQKSGTDAFVEYQMLEKKKKVNSGVGTESGRLWSKLTYPCFLVTGLTYGHISYNLWKEING